MLPTRPEDVCSEDAADATTTTRRAKLGMPHADLIAAGIEDVDIDALVGTVFGSTVAAIPGMHILTTSILTSSANAFLTLRVGMITKEYCRCTTKLEKRGIRRAATLQAAKLLGSIVRDGTVRLSKAAVNSSTAKVAKTFNRLTRRGGMEPEEA